MNNVWIRFVIIVLWAAASIWMRVNLGIFASDIDPMKLTVLWYCSSPWWLASSWTLLTALVIIITIDFLYNNRPDPHF
jgi:hypothetical protein